MCFCATAAGLLPRAPLQAGDQRGRRSPWLECQREIRDGPHPGLQPKQCESQVLEPGYGQPLNALQPNSTRMLTIGVLSITDINGALTGTATTTITFQISPPPDQRRCAYSVTGQRTGFAVMIHFSPPLPESDVECTTLARRETFAFSSLSGVIDSATSTIVRVTPVRLGGSEDREIIFRRVGPPRSDPSTGHENKLASRFSRPFALPGGANTAQLTHVFGTARVDPSQGQCSVEFRYSIIRTPVFLVRHPDGHLTYEPVSSR